ncbi:hypothetical protein [Agrobacterium tumefaciens]|uniref:Uncharacterized protein n=1 Tax=Agrobacterium tumefaciens TaxID=358 RepID=A0AB36EJS2_AGRTU|nr:hypothetical protein A6U91_07490 [Agrobacterium tumefaciens]
MTRKYWLPALISCAVLMVLFIWIAGVRIFVVQPIGALPKGVTAVVINIRGLNFIDSPDAFCSRNGSPNLLCRGMAIGRVAKEGKILLRLPYSKILYHLSGAPDY